MNIIREPVVIVNLVKAILVLAVAFGLVVSADQQNAVINFVTAAIAVAGIFGVGAKIERDNVTPVAAPRLPADTVVEVTNKNGDVVAENVTTIK